MAKITKDFVERVKPADDFKTYWDEKDKGYGLRVSPLGKKVFVVMGRVKGLGKAICITIGPASMPEHQARKAAQTILYDKFRHGIDPRAEAKAALAEKVEESVALTTLSQVLDAYLSRPGQLKDSTKAEMRRHVEKVFTAWQDKPIASITEDDCRQRYAEMYEHGLRGKPAPGQAQIAMVTLRTLINFAARRYKKADGTPILTNNPVAAVREDWKPLKQRTRDIDELSVGTAWHVLSEMRATPKNADALAGIDLTMFLLLTGARRSEGAALTWDRVHIEDDAAKCWWHLPDPKNSNPVWLPLSTLAVAILKRRMPSPDDKDASPYVFPSRSKQGYVTDTRAPLERVAKAIGVDALSAHDLRRTMVSVGFASCGIDLFKLELLTNHVPKGITAKHYLRTSRLQYLYPDVQRISDWIEREGKVAAEKASGANVIAMAQRA